MRNKTMYLYLSDEEVHIVLESLIVLKNSMLRQGRYTDCVDEVILKLANAPVKKVKTV